ncbi:MAG: hypothetical protein J2P48_18195 [Alphaproteobacteria bacterium]|nr:hypothetical protein [Alphaproteobacteria bacterium]
MPIIIEGDEGFAPTSVVSRAILVYNCSRRERLADGICITPSHNPPEDRGFKYEPSNGGPSDTDATGWIEVQADELLEYRCATASGAAGIEGVPLHQPLACQFCDFARKARGGRLF